MHVQQGQLGITNLKFSGCQMDLPRVFRYVLCSIWKYDSHKQIRRHNAKSILESHLVARRNNKITGPRDLTPESYSGIHAHEIATLGTRYRLPATPMTKSAIWLRCCD